MRLPDQVHIDEIRRCLWRSGEYGRAAVMIGSGFSRNAEPIAENVPDFPLWVDLAELMYKLLYPEQYKELLGSVTGARKQLSQINPLRLASEYELTYGRQGLDDFLLRSLQDDKYRPGKLHRLLISLPWSDIFTTNYDTLIERTLPLSYDRKYDVVFTSSDIPASTKPRIVKLHGSFPSYRPFIFTEEDYRTYPKKFAPFVNTVQQSLMENTFCLLGFSAADPNFLEWIGWVRDNIGESTPYIYLCGLLDLASSARRLLESKKIIPIDLSPMFPRENHPNEATRQSLAIEWFLSCLSQRPGPDPLTWPITEIEQDYNIQRSPNLPEVPSWSEETTSAGDLFPASSSNVTAEEVVENCKKWRKCREQYPGWIICPKDNRNTLREYTYWWRDGIFRTCEQLNPPDDLAVLYELNWRLERTLDPLWITLVDKISIILERYNPFASKQSIDGATVCINDNQYEYLDWATITEHWTELAFAVAREAREDQDEERFLRWIDRLEKAACQKAEWQARVQFEKCMFYFLRFEQGKVRNILEAWTPNAELPFWETKRASILAELGETREAERIASDALSRIRRSLSADSTNFALLSQEGWIMLVLSAVKWRLLGTQNYSSWYKERRQFKSRWDKLQSFRCNPLYELEIISATLGGAEQEKRFEKKRGFDPGVENATWSFATTNDSARIAFNLVRMLEDGALPLTLGLSVDDKNALKKAAWMIAPHARLWSVNILLRAARKEDDINDWFSRAKIATFSQEEIERFYDLFYNSLSEIVSVYGNDATSRSMQQDLPAVLMEFLPELLSRLCIRLSEDKLAQLLMLSYRLYHAPAYRYQIALYSPLKNLFERLLGVIPMSLLTREFPNLISLPIPADKDFTVADVTDWAEPFHYISWSRLSNYSNECKNINVEPSINKLIQYVQAGSVDARDRSIWRLITLRKASILTAAQEEAFAKALWSKMDENTGLPYVSHLTLSILLEMPELKRGKTKAALRKYILETDFVNCVHQQTGKDGKVAFSFTDGLSEQVNLLISASLKYIHRKDSASKKYIDWTQDEAIVLLEKCATWWNDNKLCLKDQGLYARLFGDPRHYPIRMLDLLALIILPRLDGADDGTKEKGLMLINEMEQLGLDISIALPATLLLSPTQKAIVEEHLYKGLMSSDKGRIRNSILGILEWCVLHVHKNLEPVPAPLLDTWVQFVAVRRQPGLKASICHIARLAYHLPVLLNEENLNRLCTGLEYLAQETDLLSIQNEEWLDRYELLLPEERPSIRSLSAELAYALWREYQKRGKEPPQVLVRWKKIAESDSLPEVRNAWPSDSSFCGI